MSRIDDLIAKLCPNGVEYKTLGDICNIETGKLNANDAVENGAFMFFTTAKKPSKIDKYRWDTEALLISGNANVGEVKHYIGKFDAYQRTYVLTNFISNLNVRFLFFILSSYLKKYLEDRTNSAAMTYIVLATLKNFPIPIPPLEIQREIVKVLDTFTKLEAELEAELEARRRQYHYYRDQLLNVEGRDDVQWMTLGEVAINQDSKRRPVTKSARNKGEIPYYGASGIVDYVSDYIFDGDFLLVSEDGANLIARSTPIAFSISGKTWVNNHAHVLQFNSYTERKLIEIYLNSIDLTPYISGGAQPKLNQANLNKIPIPVPPLEEQTRIVAILDKFDALVNDLSSGLPAEISARRKQYEYYRDRLLTFKEAQ